MKISILHPSVRPHKFRDIYGWWQRKFSNYCEYEYILACHDSQFPEFEVARGSVSIAVNAGPNHPTINGRSSFVDNMNCGAAISTGDVLVCATDDLEPCDEWDLLIAKRFEGDPSAERVVQIDDGFGWENMLRHPIMSRSRYERQGWFFCPEFTGMYSDNDLLALSRGVLEQAPEIKFIHHNPLAGGNWQMDVWYQFGNASNEYKKGKEVLDSRWPSEQ